MLFDMNLVITKTGKAKQGFYKAQFQKKFSNKMKQD